MIDFQREDAELLSAAGFTAQQLLGRLGGGCAAGLERLRDRYQTLASAHGVSDAVRLERDRLDSLMLELHGPRGLLRRAGALVALKERLERLATLTPRCGGDAEVAGRLRREALILRAYGREQVGRTQGGAATALSTSLGALAEAVGGLHGFCLEARSLDGQRGSQRKANLLRSAAGAALRWPEEKTIGDAVAFVLQRLSESAESVDGHYHALCQQHAARLRDGLWEAAEGGYARRDQPATLRDVTELDLTLELLCGKLADARLDSEERCEAIGELYALVAASRAQDAAALAHGLLAPLVDVLRTGIEAEAHLA
ncbi:MAG TPA: hypothetical protein VK447_02085 [Myxococcaceae bacterium]|nr:hypothetical protein [Myxococcaceae bacterium]